MKKRDVRHKELTAAAPARIKVSRLHLFSFSIIMNNDAMFLALATPKGKATSTGKNTRNESSQPANILPYVSIFQ